MPREMYKASHIIRERDAILGYVPMDKLRRSARRELIDHLLDKMAENSENVDNYIMRFSESREPGYFSFDIRILLTAVPVEDARRLLGGR